VTALETAMARYVTVADATASVSAMSNGSNRFQSASHTLSLVLAPSPSRLNTKKISFVGISDYHPLLILLLVLMVNADDDERHQISLQVLSIALALAVAFVASSKNQ
jgi:hypothetical protein